ncbi:hypothetical protein EVAR_5260_1 [Eumeta japonica]|uniref:Helitron helicase-like domain-containing protein n=1 Tax=Eumeta variegata TaxID=151549 RepID=A0A4C1XR92_EUMVA|nr:hypothetical protein EVAR_5260_1 [Eumeta japonica]
MNMAAHPTQNDEGVFERPLHGQLYFLDPDDAVNERVNHPLNSGISSSLMELLEYIIRARNGYVQGYRMMRDVEEDINRLSFAQGISPPYVKLLFRQPEQADRGRYNIPVCNEVCAVFTLNADQSFPDNEMIVHQRNKNIVYLKNIDKRVEPFTYPLFYPAGTDGYSVDLPLQTPYASRNHLTRLELAQYRLSFRPEYIKFSMDATSTGRPDLQEIPFNALHFGHDCASIKVVEEQRTLIYNEANTYIDGRCVTPPEACWRLFAEIQKSHSIQRLDIHLPGQYRIANLDQIQEDLADVGQRGSTLDAYFKHNKQIKELRELSQSNVDLDNMEYHYYWQMPEHFRWVGRSSKWERRIRHRRVIGRIHNVNYAAQPELYHLRLLLYHIKDATNFEDLRTVNDTQYQTYKQACLARV